MSGDVQMGSGNGEITHSAKDLFPMQIVLLVSCSETLQAIIHAFNHK